MQLPIVATVIRTCTACPSQWSIHLSDGRYVYARYRGGLFRAELAESEDAWWYSDKPTYEPPTLLLRVSIGDPLDGFMTDEEMMEQLKGILDFSQATVVPDDYSINPPPV